MDATGTSIAQGVIVALIALLASVVRLEIWHVYTAGLFTGILAALALPAYMAIVPDLIPKENLIRANSLLSLSVYVTGVIGPILGAITVNQMGYPASFALNAISYFISSVFLANIYTHLKTNQFYSVSRIQLWKDLSAGYRFVASQAWLWFSMLLLLWINFTGRSTMNVVLPFLVEGSLQDGIGSLGLLRSVFSVGSMLGALWAGGRMKTNRKGWLFYGSLFLAGLLTAVMGLPFSLFVLGTAMLLMGASLAVNNLVWSVALQERVPRTLLGRVASLSNVSSTALLPLGFALAGVSTDQIGAPLVFLLSGLVMALLASLGLLYPKTRRI